MGHSLMPLLSLSSLGLDIVQGEKEICSRNVRWYVSVRIHRCLTRLCTNLRAQIECSFSHAQRFFHTVQRYFEPSKYIILT